MLPRDIVSFTTFSGAIEREQDVFLIARFNSCQVSQNKEDYTSQKAHSSPNNPVSLS